MDDQLIFPYIDGIPTKGCWVKIDELTDWDDIRTAMAIDGVFDCKIPINTDDPEDPDAYRSLETARKLAAEQYGGDILVACTDGALAGYFLSKHDGFELDEFKLWAEFLLRRDDIDEDVVVAYLSWTGTSVDHFEESYSGTYKSKEDWAEGFISKLYSIPEGLENYIDYEKFVRDCEMSDYNFEKVSGGVAVFRDT